MSPLLGPRKGKKDRSLAQASLLAAVPAILAAAPLIGFFAGRWADKHFGTEPYLTVVGIALGFSAAAREIYNLVKKAQALDNDKDND
ncbi:MAG TPA: AtpZ/AtpI family protein [Acidobacteriota bacterium]|nr:AtpZ/AtpI family protein [Acidobacteriota bacterium]